VSEGSPICLTYRASRRVIEVLKACKSAQADHRRCVRLREGASALCPARPGGDCLLFKAGVRYGDAASMAVIGLVVRNVSLIPA